MPPFFRCSALFLLAACSLRAAAQKHTYELKGFIGIQGGESFTYKLDLKDSSAGLLSGYAYTYLNEKNDVKAYVVAEADRVQKTLKIRETMIVHNHYFQSRATICLVEALLSYNPAEKNLSGPLITMTAGNGASCSKGSISFGNAAEISNLFEPKAQEPQPAAVESAPPKTGSSRKPVRVVYDTLPPGKASVAAKEPPKEKAPEQITEGKDKTYLWTSGQIVLELWDGNNVDNDRVTILMNGTEVLKSYVLRKEKKTLSLPVGGNELNIISIIADNEGGDPPNTANISLYDGAIRYDIIAHNTIGKQALIRIRKKL